MFSHLPCNERIISLNQGFLVKYTVNAEWLRLLDPSAENLGNEIVIFTFSQIKIKQT